MKGGINKLVRKNRNTLHPRKKRIYPEVSGCFPRNIDSLVLPTKNDLLIIRRKGIHQEEGVKDKPRSKKITSGKHCQRKTKR